MYNYGSDAENLKERMKEAVFAAYADAKAHGEDASDRLRVGPGEVCVITKRDPIETLRIYETDEYLEGCGIDLKFIKGFCEYWIYALKRKDNPPTHEYDITEEEDGLFSVSFHRDGERIFVNFAQDDEPIRYSASKDEVVEHIHFIENALFRGEPCIWNWIT